MYSPEKISVGRIVLLYCTVQRRYQWAEQDYCIIQSREDISWQNRTTVLDHPGKISVGRTGQLYCTSQGRYQWAEQNYCTDDDISGQNSTTVLYHPGKISVGRTELLYWGLVVHIKNISPGKPSNCLSFLGWDMA